LDRNEGGNHKFPGKRHLLSFLSWLDYIDQLIRESHQVIHRDKTEFHDMRDTSFKYQHSQVPRLSPDSRSYTSGLNLYIVCKPWVSRKEEYLLKFSYCNNLNASALILNPRKLKIQVVKYKIFYSWEFKIASNRMKEYNCTKNCQITN
jgi:hypothetical protein